MAIQATNIECECGDASCSNCKTYQRALRHALRRCAATGPYGQSFRRALGLAPLELRGLNRLMAAQGVDRA